MVNKHNVYNVGLKESENCPLPSHNAPKLPIRTPNDNQPVVIDPVTGRLYTRDPQVSPADLEAAENRLGKKLEQKVEEETKDVVKKGDTSVASAPDKIVTRDSQGCINIQYPTAGSHGANKTYVDDNITAVRNEAYQNALNTTQKFSEMAVDIDNKYADAKQYAENQIQAAVEAIVGDLAFTYDSYEDFIDSIMYTSDGTNLTFTGIISEDGEEFTYDKLKKPGVQILIREESVPDYWLSRLVIPEAEDIINFFTEFETKVNLNDYYNKEEIEQKLEDLDTTKRLTGEEIENGTFENGEIIWCTASSDFFSANKYYIYNNGVFNPISIGSNIAITPSISALNVTTNPTSVDTIEVGKSFDVTKFTASLKKYADFAKVVFGITDVGGTNNVEETITDITSNSVSLTTNHTLKKSKFGSFTAWVRGYNSDNTQIGYTSYTLSTSVARQYYGIAPDNPNLEVMTSELATSYYKSITSNTNEIQTVLKSSRTTIITLKLSDTPTYVWFIIPSNLSISKMTSGGFDFPFIQQNNVTINNQYNTDIEYKVYRSANKIYGTTTINLS